MRKLRVLLVDDQVLLREGLKTIINLQEDMEVVGEADHGKAALAQLESDLTVDVVLMDIRMPVLNGVDATALIKKHSPEVAIIILTTFDDDEFIVDALCNGADGYLLKDIDAAHLVQCIRDAGTGQMMLPAKIAAKLAGRISGQRPVVTSTSATISFENQVLSDREKEIGALLAEGLSNSQIARKLFLSEGTVKNYISELYQKLGTRNRVKAGMLVKQMLDSSL